jgi:hypothetical protein
VSAANQELPQQLVAFLGDVPLRVPLFLLILGRHESQISPYAATLCESLRVFQGQHEGERGKCPDPLDLAQEIRFWIVLLADRFQPTVKFADTL